MGTRERLHQRSFATDPSLSPALFALLETSFKGIGQAAAKARRWGAGWEDASTPFIASDSGRVIAHVGVLPIPMTVMGRAVDACGIHAVCTHPDFRRRGHFRRLMGEALEYCDERSSLAVLFTHRPELYVPFGFRAVAEHRFVVAVSHSGGGKGWRRQDVENARDQQIVPSLCAGRCSVSQILGVRNEQAIFAFNAVFNPLLYCDELDTMIAARVEGRVLHLLDVVGRSMCSVEQIVVRFAQPIEEVIVHFAPDQLRCEAVSAEWRPQEMLMVRGKFPAEGRHFAFPPMARC